LSEFVGPSASKPNAARRGPTWVVPAQNDGSLFVACNANSSILEVDFETLTVTRRFEAGKGPYNPATTSGGRLPITTNKGAQSASIFDLREGSEIARIPTSQPVTHGVTVSTDDRLAFVSNEAIGAMRGTVDVIDLAMSERVASISGRWSLWRDNPDGSN